MRINKFIALATGMSRRAVDQAIQAGRVRLNGMPIRVGAEAANEDIVTLDGKTVTLPQQTATIMLHKPAGYVVSRDGQGSPTIYELLPFELHKLKPVGRLDKDSSGLLLLTDDGTLAHELTHPSFQKTKVYEIALDKPLAALHQQMINDMGVLLDDGPSKLHLEKLDTSAKVWRIAMHEGRNRQIRRTFDALGYTVSKLHRIRFGQYELGALKSGSYTPLT